MENNVESVDLIQTQILGLKELAQMVAVIDILQVEELLKQKSSQLSED